MRQTQIENNILDLWIEVKKIKEKLGASIQKDEGPIKPKPEPTPEMKVKSISELTKELELDNSKLFDLEKEPEEVSPEKVPGVNQKIPENPFQKKNEESNESQTGEDQ